MIERNKDEKKEEWKKGKMKNSVLSHRKKVRKMNKVEWIERKKETNKKWEKEN